ncbi:unnamed protein product [Eretmochelys imbricata]
MAGSKALSFWYRQLQGAGGGPERPERAGEGDSHVQSGGPGEVSARRRWDWCTNFSPSLQAQPPARPGSCSALLCCPGKPGASPGSARRGGDAGGRRTELGRGWVAAAWTVVSERPGEPTDLEERLCPGINPGEF